MSISQIPENRVERIASHVGDLPALPQVASRVVRMVTDPRTTARQLEEIIRKDPAMTAKILRIANSAFYGLRGEVSTLSRAIVILGFNTLRSVVLTSISEAMHTGDRSNFKDRILWEHAIAVAIAARTIARECGYAFHEEAYTGGLLHDIGKAVMDTNLDRYQEVMELVYNEGMTFVEAENDVFGFDHAEVGALVVERWSLAPPLCEAVRLHHQPMAAEVEPTLCAIVSLANSMCTKLGLGPERDASVDLTGLDATLMLTLSPERLDDIAEAVSARLESEKHELSM